MLRAIEIGGAVDVVANLADMVNHLVLDHTLTEHVVGAHRDAIREHDGAGLLYPIPRNTVGHEPLDVVEVSDLPETVDHLDIPAQIFDGDGVKARAVQRVNFGASDATGGEGEQQEENAHGTNIHRIKTYAQ